MDDFIYSLRVASNKHVDGNRKQYDNRGARNFDRQRTRDRRNGYHHQKGNQEHLSLIKPLLEEIAENHKRIAAAGERRASAEERKADALTGIAECLRAIAGLAPSPTAPDTVVSSPAPDKENAAMAEDDTEESAAVGHEEILSIISQMRENKVSYEKIARHLTSERIPTPSGKGKWSRSTVARLYGQ